MKKFILCISLIFCGCSTNTGSVSENEMLFLSLLRGSYKLTTEGADALNNDYLETAPSTAYSDENILTVNNSYIDIDSGSTNIIFKLAEALSFTNAVYQAVTYSPSKLTDGIYFMVYLDSSTNIYFSKDFTNSSANAVSLANDYYEFATRYN